MGDPLPWKVYEDGNLEAGFAYKAEAELYVERRQKEYPADALSIREE